MVTIEDSTIIRAPIERCFDLARSVEVHLAGNVHFGEQAVASAGVTSGLIGMAQGVNWRAKHFGVRHNLTSEITGPESTRLVSGHHDSGNFPIHEARSFLSSSGPGGNGMKDVFCFAAPLPFLGRLAEVTFLGRYMQVLLRERNAVIKEMAESSDWQRYLP